MLPRSKGVAHAPAQLKPEVRLRHRELLHQQLQALAVHYHPGVWALLFVTRRLQCVAVTAVQAVHLADHEPLELCDLVAHMPAKREPERWLPPRMTGAKQNSEHGF